MFLFSNQPFKFNKKNFVAILLTCVLLIVSNFIVNSQETDDFRYFESTGHYVKDDYLKFYESFNYPELIFGAPITENFFYDEINREVQFFQKARFERTNDGISIQLSPIGEHYFQKDVSYRTVIDFPSIGCKSYSDNDSYSSPVCFDFRTFYEFHGGFVQFGYPISEALDIDGKIVQYFQNCILEWYPDDFSIPIQVGDLGKDYFKLLNIDTNYLDAVNNSNSLGIKSNEIIAYSSIKNSSISTYDEQILSVFVTNSFEIPQKGTYIEAQFQYPNGKVYDEVLPLTNDLGISKFIFSIPTNENFSEETVYVELFIFHQSEIISLYQSFLVK